MLGPGFPRDNPSDASFVEREERRWIRSTQFTHYPTARVISSDSRSRLYNGDHQQPSIVPVSMLSRPCRCHLHPQKAGSLKPGHFSSNFFAERKALRAAALARLVRAEGEAERLMSVRPPGFGALRCRQEMWILPSGRKELLHMRFSGKEFPPESWHAAPLVLGAMRRSRGEGASRSHLVS